MKQLVYIGSFLFIFATLSCTRVEKKATGNNLKMMMMADNDSTIEFRKSLSKNSKDTAITIVEINPYNKGEIPLMMSSDAGEGSTLLYERKLEAGKPVKFPQERKPVN